MRSVGRRRYQLLISLIPLNCAISGNVALQASTLTTTAVSLKHVSQESFLRWWGEEMGASCYLGAATAALLGFIAFFASEMDLSFSVTIMISHFMSVLFAACMGTLSPLCSVLIFRRHSRKWSGQFETAIQDVVGSFASIFLSFQLLLLFGQGPIDESDMCGSS